MRVDGLVVEQIALPVQANHLTPCSKSRVDGQHIFLPQWRRQQQLPKVLRKDPNSLLFGPFFGRPEELGLDRRANQPFVTLRHRLLYEPHGRPVLCLPPDEDPLQPFAQRLLLRRLQPQREFQHPGLFAPHHGHQPMAGTVSQRLVPIEIVRILDRLFRLRIDPSRSLGTDPPARSESPPHPLSGRCRLADPLGHDIRRAGQGSGYVRHLLSPDEPSGQSLRILGLPHEGRGQRLQSPLPRHHPTGPPFGFVGQVEIFDHRPVPTPLDRFAQLRRQLPLFVDRLQDRGFPLLQIGVFGVQVADPLHCDLVQSAGGLFAVAADERHRTTVVQQPNRMLGLTDGREGELSCDKFRYNSHLSIFIGF